MQRALRQSLLATYPLLAAHADEIVPRKGSLEAMKLPDRCTLYVLDGEPLFFQHDGNALLPHLRLVHRFPAAFPSIRIDRGAIRFVLSGATLMAPGLTSPGGRLPKPPPPPSPSASLSPAPAAAEEASAAATAEGETGAGEGAGAEGGEVSGGGGVQEGLDEEEHWTRELQKGEPVVVRAEGKTEACAVGFLLMGTQEVKEKGKGPVIEDAHYLGDGLWRLN